MDVTSPANCTCFNLRKAARAVTQVYDEALRPSGLKATQLSLLYVVDHLGPSGITELARTLVMDRTTLTRNLKPLMEQRLLEIVEGADRRRRPIALTPRGRNKLAEALPLWQEVQACVAHDLGRGRWANLLRGLDEAARLYPPG
jgi:DNA-binding MarR family transcriptional regulator